MSNAPLDKTGTLMAGGNKVAPKTWFSCVVNDEDPEQTLLVLAGLLNNAFTDVAQNTRNSIAMTFRFSRINGTNRSIAIRAATTSLAGLMTADDKTKLDDIPTPSDIATKGNVIGDISASRTATALTLTLWSAEDENMGNVSIPAATQAAAGLMTAADKTLLDRLMTALTANSPYLEYFKPRTTGITKLYNRSLSPSVDLGNLYAGETVYIKASKNCTVEVGSVQMATKTLNLTAGEEVEAYVISSDITAVSLGVSVTDISTILNVDLTFLILQ